MLVKKVTKLWQDKYTSVRDYEVTNAIKKGGLVILHNEQQMILNVDELKTLKPSTKNFQSKFKGSYKLVDITFNPNTADHRQGDLL
jgi:hypothetical protein